MKRKQKQTVKDKNISELNALIQKEKDTIKKDVLKFADIKDKNSIKKKRRNIARMLTYIAEKAVTGENKNG